MTEEQVCEGISETKRIMHQVLERTALRPLAGDLDDVVVNGKMLRGRLVLRVGSATGVRRETLCAAAAVVEMLHAASLLHDDVVDGALIRRSAPSFWVQKGIAGSVLLGDLLVAEAFKLTSEMESGRFMGGSIKFVREMCEAEVEQELLLKKKTPEWAKCVDVARRKTGALFAFAGHMAAGGDSGLCAALEQAGYDVGTAYQLADDLFDSFGDPAFAGKTLGSDAASGKITAASSWRAGKVGDPRVSIREFCESSFRHLVPWKAVDLAWREYLDLDVLPAINCLTAAAAGSRAEPA